MKEEFYAEWVNYDNEDEKKDIELYLKLWKRFFLKKSKFKFINENWVDRKNIFGTEISTLGLKIKVINEDK